MRFFIVPALFVAAVVAGPIFQPRSENEVERVERDLTFDSSAIAELELRDLDLSELFKRAKQSGGRGLDVCERLVKPKLQTLTRTSNECTVTTTKTSIIPEVRKDCFQDEKRHQDDESPSFTVTVAPVGIDWV
ncbi:hypothetical protein C8J56DRAFT_1156611 [Mycena floridula]|nr:hypothetical protein C8J56DRAFT_1172776 [Mycena floridula]KAJ7600010.1 hypothetical protein C8J56DRAFT_1156611 [Mycena floridula]